MVFTLFRPIPVKILPRSGRQQALPILGCRQTQPHQEILEKIMQIPNTNVVKAQTAVIAEFLTSKGLEASQPAILTLLAKLQVAESSVVGAAKVQADAAAENWTASAGAMTDEQYVTRGGNCCPSCGSHDISGGSITVDGRSAYQGVTCADCDAEWNDTYTLTGYDDLEGGIDKDNVDAVVADVKDRGERHGFNVDDEAQANDCVDGSAEILGLTLSDAEKKLAVRQLLE
ncbi:formate dehydrogenase accessory protein FdhE [Paraburkholderia sp. EG287A]|uniref:formate dehydrogenase accessory protein FdhE domain-containing protein n=1 Tax=Paraburkholderia sp. EG287A TaxID=3237012 RepID=UPI0034D2A8F2